MIEVAKISFTNGLNRQNEQGKQQKNENVARLGE